MTPSVLRRMILQSCFSLLVLGIFIFWVETDPAGMHAWLGEDGLIESLGAAFFGLSSIAFLIAAKRSTFLKSQSNNLRYFMIISWALLMFIFMGEEISWGQRIFGFNTPEALAAINGQNEFNLHNIEFVDSFMGGKYRYLSIMMITTGLILPVMAITKKGKKFIQWWAFPVAPLSFGILFVGAYIYGKFYLTATLHSNDATETREFLMAVAMLLFSMHGATHPNDLFRIKDNLD